MFLRNLLEARETGVADVIDDDVTQEVLFMMMAGIETSGLTMCYTLMMLAMHPKLQVKIHLHTRVVIYEIKMVSIL